VLRAEEWMDVFSFPRLTKGVGRWPPVGPGLATEMTARAVKDGQGPERCRVSAVGRNSFKAVCLDAG
jgi:hypothetical protein